MMKRTCLFALLLLTVLGLSFGAGCSGDSDRKGDDKPAGTEGALMGRVSALSQQGGAPIAAKVTINGVTVDANDQGWFSFSSVAGNQRLLVEVSGPGYVTTQRIVTVAPGTVAFLDARMFQREPYQSIDASQGGELTFGNSRINLPANALRTASGQAFTGTASVSLTNIDPSLPEAQMATPGDFTALAGEGGEASRLESYGMVNLDIVDEQDNALELNTDAEVSIPLAATLVGQGTPDTMPMWRYDEGQGRWIEDGELTFDPNTNTFQGTVDRNAFWNADMLFEAACLKGRIVKPDGSGAPSVEVTAAGVGYIGNSTAWTDGNGRFQIDVMASSAQRTVGVQLQAQGGGLYLDTPVTIPATPTQLTAAGCDDVGEITLAYPLAHFVLTWGELPRDLDSQLTGPLADSEDRFHIYFSRRRVGDQAFLDTDDTTSYGPEVVSILQAVPGTYVYSVKNYSGESSGPIMDSGGHLAVYMPSGMHFFDVADATNNATANSTIWRVFQFDIRDNGTFGPVQALQEVVDETPEAYQP